MAQHLVPNGLLVGRMKERKEQTDSHRFDVVDQDLLYDRLQFVQSQRGDDAPVGSDPLRHLEAPPGRDQRLWFSRVQVIECGPRLATDL